MKAVLKKLLLANLPLKLISLTLGYAFWCMLSQTHVATREFSVPLTFYNVPEQLIVQAPESVRVTLVGKRIDFWNLDRKALAAHIDLTGKQTGDHPITICAADLFLPDTIKVVHYAPSNISVQLRSSTIAVSENNIN
jgi:YbbR domain-containing protein